MSEPTATPALGLRDHLRGVLVAAHLLAVGLLALPSPGRVTEHTLRDPALQEVLADWWGVAASVGLSMSKAETEAVALTSANAFMDVRKAVLDPFQPYFRYSGARQSWRMFGYLNRTPARFRLEAYTPGVGWSTLYEARTRAHTWNGRQLDAERFRAMINAYSWKRSRKGYDRFVDWLACTAAPDVPDATKIRASMLRLRLPPPDTLRELGAVPVTGTFWETERQLAPCRGEGSP